jgi:hypothetical protein
MIIIIVMVTVGTFMLLLSVEMGSEIEVLTFTYLHSKEAYDDNNNLIIVPPPRDD